MYREEEGWTFAALMDDETGIHGDDGKKWFPKSADPGEFSPYLPSSSLHGSSLILLGPVKKEERDSKRGELIRTRDRFRYRRICVPRQAETRSQFRFRNYKRLPIAVIMSRLINDIPGQKPYEIQSNTTCRTHPSGRRKSRKITKTKPTEMKRMTTRRLPRSIRQIVPTSPTFRVSSRPILDRRDMSAKMARTIPWKEPRESSDPGIGSGSEERQKFRTEILSYNRSLARVNSPTEGQRHWLKTEIRDWPAGMLSTVRHLPPTPTFPSPVLTGCNGLAPSPIPHGPMTLSPVMGYPTFTSAPPTPRPHVMVPGPMSAALPATPFPGARGALPRIPRIGVSQIPFRPSQATAPLPSTAEHTAATYHVDHPRTRSPAAPDVASATPLMSPWTAPRPPNSPGGPRPLPNRRETAPAQTSSPAHSPAPAHPANIPAVQPRRSPALTSGPKRPTPVHGFQPTHTPNQSGTPYQSQNQTKSPDTGMLATPRQPVYPPVPKQSKTNSAPLVHPQPRRVYERPAVPNGGRSPAARGENDGITEYRTPREEARPDLLSPVNILGGQFSRAVPGGLRQGNRAAKRKSRKQTPWAADLGRYRLT